MIAGGPEEPGDRLAHVGHGDQDAPQEDRADHERADHGREHGLRRLLPRVVRLLRQRRRRVEPVDHVQAHEHRHEEEAERERRRELEDVARSCPESKMTPMPWLSCAIARKIANTTIPRISKKRRCC